MSPTLPPIPTSWTVTHGGCGVLLTSDCECSLRAGHYPQTMHRAYDPSGSGNWIEYDADGTVTDRKEQPVSENEHVRLDTAQKYLDQRDEARADAKRLREGLAEVNQDVHRLERALADQQALYDDLKRRFDRRGVILHQVDTLMKRLEREGINCECGHDVGGEHNGYGCYARISYQPFVKCTCPLDDSQDQALIVVGLLKAALNYVETT